MNIAILALQGAFAEHRQMLERLGAHCFEVRNAADWNRPKDGLIIPGGESTTQAKLLRELDLLPRVKDYIEKGGAVFGTCAGLILLSKDVEGETFERLATMHTHVKRNAYGRQLGSFETVARMEGVGEIPMIFIRAPYITKVDTGVDVLAKVEGRIVAARERRQLVTAFHPELGTDTRVHEYFLRMMEAN